MIDVFYFGPKPNLFAFEKPATSIDDAAAQCRTGFYWYIYGLNDYTGFDFEYRPVPWEANHVHVWPSQWQKDGWVYLAHCDTVANRQWHFRTEQLVKRKPDPTNEHWIVPVNIDDSKFDFSWHPDVHEPEYEYHFGTQWQSSGGPVWRGSAGVKLVDSIRAVAITNTTNWTVPDYVDPLTVDMSWHPNPLDPAYIYHFPSQWQSASGVTYIVNDAKEIKLVDAFSVKALPTSENWTIPDYIDSSTVDMSWHPNPLDPAYVYHFPSQWQSASGVTYIVNDAKEIKLVDAFSVKALANKDAWTIPDYIDSSTVDMSWHPNPLDPAYIYHFPSQWQSASGVTYIVNDAKEIKLVDAFSVKALANKDAWTIPDCVAGFDYSWHPNPLDPVYINEFGTQWYSEGGPVYAQSGATEYRYLDEPRARLKPSTDNWECLHNIDKNRFDFSWRPHPKEPPYIYVWGNQYWPSTKMPTVQYRVPGATEFKYMDGTAHLLPNRDFWKVPDHIDASSIDFAWVPDPNEPPYIYEFATQHQPNGGARYCVPGATEIKYVDSAHRCLSRKDGNWIIPDDIDPASIDFSWHPSNTEKPYIYEFATQHQPNGGARYCVPGATEVKYVELEHRRFSDKTNWIIPDDIDPASIDFSWHPSNTEKPYIYEFATQWQPNGGARYCVPGATEIKYVDSAHRCLSRKDGNWQALHDISDFDYSWHPSNTEEPYIYVFGNQHYPGTIMPTVTYTVPGATKEKFIDLPVAQLVEDRANWEVLEPIDEAQWDWTWRPNPKDPAYIYAFGNQWNPAEYKASVRYVVPGATETKYMEQRTVRLPQPELFRFNLAVADFDYSWEPNPFDPPMTYAFGNQWNPAVLEPTVIYNAGGTEVKYMDEPVAQAAQDMTHWEILDEIQEFDYSWRPNPTDPPYIYVFGNQWLTPEQRPAVRYVVPTATQLKYIDEPKAQRVGNPEKFNTFYDCDFDYSWEPDPGSPPYNYVFGNQHWPAEIMPTVKYTMVGATANKFVDEPVAKLKPTTELWNTVTDIPFDFDYSWCPDPGDPAYNYVFGNQWYPAEEMPTVEYRMPGATEYKYVDSQRAQLLPVMERWSIPEEVNAANIDFSWVPHPKDEPYIHHFGSEYQMSTGLTYTVPGAVEPKFEGDPPLLSKEKKAVDVLDIFFVDRSNKLSGLRFERLQATYPNIQKIRYANSMMATIQRCLTRARTRKFWIISSENDYTEFDFAWHAEPWQGYMTHVFGSQWNKWSDTFLINKWEFERHSQWAKGIEEFPNLNFVKNQLVRASDDANNIYYMDWGNPESAEQLARLKLKYPNIKPTRYVDNHLDTFKRIMSTAESEHVWIISSICDYSKFDFSWQPEAWQAEMIHVFPSSMQERGDTFYIHVESFKQQLIELELLDWFNVINYCDDQVVNRWLIPHHYYETDDLVTEIKNYTFTHPYAVFANHKSITAHEDLCLWSRKDRTVKAFTASGSVSLVPRDIKADLRTQIYDYPYVNTKKTEYFDDESLDIVYISNGEPDADRWYNHLCNLMNQETPGFPTLVYSNRIARVSNVNGRAAAYQAAAQASRTPWFFAVFAKLEVDDKFDWDWQPDYWQEPKHYIFNARNPVNGLEYGHQAMIAYNKRLVLETEETGLDFTLSQAHEVVPILSGTAHFNQDPWMTWRTAFREVLKLRQFMDTDPTLETESRLDTWLTRAEGNFAEWCLRGANDAVEYYKSVNGNQAELMKSFEWQWLRSYYNSKYN